MSGFIDILIAGDLVQSTLLRVGESDHGFPSAIDERFTRSLSVLIDEIEKEKDFIPGGDSGNIIRTEDLQWCVDDMPVQLLPGNLFNFTPDGFFGFGSLWEDLVP